MVVAPKPTLLLTWMMGAACTSGVVDLEGREGERVVVSGVLVDSPQQHYTRPPSTHPATNFVGVGRRELVVYSTKPIDCPGRHGVTVQGVVHRIEGPNKRSTGPFVVHQIAADHWTCDGPIPDAPKSRE